MPRAAWSAWPQSHRATLILLRPRQPAHTHFVDSNQKPRIDVRRAEDDAPCCRPYAPAQSFLIASLSFAFFRANRGFSLTMSYSGIARIKPAHKYFKSFSEIQRTAGNFKSFLFDPVINPIRFRPIDLDQCEQ